MKQTILKKTYVSPHVTVIETQMNACILSGTSSGGNTGGDNMNNGGEYSQGYNEHSSPWAYGEQ